MHTCNLDPISFKASEEKLKIIFIYDFKINKSLKNILPNNKTNNAIIGISELIITDWIIKLTEIELHFVNPWYKALKK